MVLKSDMALNVTMHILNVLVGLAAVKRVVLVVSFRHVNLKAACRDITIMCTGTSESYHYSDCGIVTQWHKYPDLLS